MSEKQHTPEESNHYLNALDILNDGDGDYKVKTIADLLAKVEELRLLLLRAEMYVLPTEQTNGLLKEIRKALE